jgi:hypothetical protein
MPPAAPAAARRAPRRAPRSGARARPRPRPRPRAQARGATPAAGAAQLIPVAVGRTAGAVGDLADSGLMVRMTRGRAWIAVLAALLAGIVALNVLSLSYSTKAGQVAERSASLERENSVLRAQLSNKLASKRVESIAASLGLEVPDPRETVFLRPDKGDPEVAARRVKAGELAASPDLAAAPTTEAPPVVAP